MYTDITAFQEANSNENRVSDIGNFRGKSKGNTQVRANGEHGFELLNKRISEGTSGERERGTYQRNGGKKVNQGNQKPIQVVNRQTSDTGRLASDRQKRR